ncbi:uncharacterized protein LOC133203689 [Saccostrea echinata]|uniref:uncharacterized protein LOC133203689 n=1 Tax=Saccostrea echinata TaxID=191078 RepID=UPI002A83318A|nr:uncharacterized protein LOC133203689 [Saccostrea echinata]
MDETITLLLTVESQKAINNCNNKSDLEIWTEFLSTDNALYLVFAAVLEFAFAEHLLEFASLRLCGDTSDIIPDPTDCGYFFDCTNYYAVRQRCAPGTFFNDLTKKCDFPENVPRCEKQLYGEFKNNYNMDGVADPNEIIVVNPGNQDDTEVKSIPSEAKQASNSAVQSDKKDIVIGNNTTNGNHDPFCFGKKVGNYPDPNNCDFFYQCSLILSRRQKCAPGTVFNPKKDRCDFPSQVKGCENSFTRKRYGSVEQTHVKKEISGTDLKKAPDFILQKFQRPSIPSATTTSSKRFESSTITAIKQDTSSKQLSLTNTKSDESLKKTSVQTTDKKTIKPSIKDAVVYVKKEGEKPNEKDLIFKQRTVDTKLFRTGNRNLNMRFSLRDLIRNGGKNQPAAKEAVTTTAQPTSTRHVRSTTTVLLPVVPTKASYKSMLANDSVSYSEENQSKVQNTRVNGEVVKSYPQTFDEIRSKVQSSLNKVVVSEYIQMVPTKSEQMGDSVHSASGARYSQRTTAVNAQTTTPSPKTVDEVLEKVGHTVKQATVEGVLSAAPSLPLDTYSVHVDKEGQARKFPVIETGDINGNFGSQKGILSSIGSTLRGKTVDKNLRDSIEAKLKALMYLTTFIKSERLNEIFRETLRKSKLMDKFAKKTTNGSKVMAKTGTKRRGNVHYPRLIIVTSMGSGDSNKKLLEQFEVGLPPKQRN